MPVFKDDVITRGSGRRDDPFVLPVRSNSAAILGVLDALKRWEGGFGNCWRVLDWRKADDDDPRRQTVRILRRRFLPGEVTTDRMAFHLDFSKVHLPEVPAHSPVMWEGHRGLGFPNDLAWMHLDRITYNSATGAPLDVTLAYSSPVGQAALYIYGACATDDGRAVVREAEEAFACAVGLHNSAETPWPFDSYGPQHGRFFRIEERSSYVGVCARAGKLVKVRLTFADKSALHREMLSKCLDSIFSAIEGKVTSWASDAHL